VPNYTGFLSQLDLKSEAVNILPNMNANLIESEGWIRLAFFLGILATMLLLELLLPRRQMQRPRHVRWANNLGLVATDVILVRLVTPFSLLWLANDIESRGIGLFNLLELPFWIGLAISVVILDLAVYFQHRAFHLVPVLWRLHRVHHTDTEYDTTTGLRFHPIEILLSIAIKMAMILLLGAPVLAVLIFEILLNGMALFNHANLKLPIALDRTLRRLVVTPDMHRVHHSIEPNEFNTNFGFNLSCWDRLFHSYLDQPKKGHESMLIGQSNYRSSREARLDRMLLQPFLQSEKTS